MHTSTNGNVYPPPPLITVIAPKIGLGPEWRDYTTTLPKRLPQQYSVWRPCGNNKLPMPISWGASIPAA